MSYTKAHDLMRLAQMAAARHSGVTLDEIAEEFGIVHRSAQRMTNALEAIFLCEVTDGPDRKRRWKIREPRPLRLPRRPDRTIAALDCAIRDARAVHRNIQAEALADLRDALITQMVPQDARRAEADAEAMLQALGHVARPGPRIRTDPVILGTISTAIRGMRRLRLRYGDGPLPRTVDPRGILLGERTYLVACDPARGPRPMTFRLDRIHEAECLSERSEPEPGFNIDAYAAQNFGVWDDPEQRAEVIWRFTPEAADHARDFLFHPHQSLEPQEDGSLIVRFTASGWLEMAWFLYKWGDKVEVLAPEGLRRMVEGHRRSDFGTAMP
ncbi:helix-turn-helix transcriptional regulator [Falsirhodobacter algicola]|uniref:WYL domain-containing protein n=1 Tax=Falsirhodobacter algicola TaxID=2692330 RepID=A0A8J8MV12_9RHOB|nr:WYL domain-containing protein [Falsirhodobacter algicola]QUS37215.1 WYL domain-containing protein [Falsirhodobacter algicola]